MYGAEIVKGVMTKLWVSRGGLRELEIVDICAGKLMNFSYFFQVLRSFSPYFSKNLPSPTHHLFHFLPLSSSPPFPSPANSPHVQTTSDGRLSLHRRSLREAVKRRYLGGEDLGDLSSHANPIWRYFNSPKNNPAVQSNSVFSSLRNFVEFLHARLAVGKEAGGRRCWEVLCECENFLLLSNGGVSSSFVTWWGRAGRVSG